MTLSPDVIDGLPHVEGVLNYLAPMAERPINLAYDPSPGVPRSTGEPEPHRVVIYDARPLAGRLSLDSEGLAVVKHNSAVRDFPCCGGRMIIVETFERGRSPLHRPLPLQGDAALQSPRPASMGDSHRAGAPGPARLRWPATAGRSARIFRVLREARPPGSRRGK